MRGSVPSAVQKAADIRLSRFRVKPLGRTRVFVLDIVKDVVLPPTSVHQLAILVTDLTGRRSRQGVAFSMDVRALVDTMLEHASEDSRQAGTVHLVLFPSALVRCRTIFQSEGAMAMALATFPERSRYGVRDY